jgi:hypothetical protein
MQCRLPASWFPQLTQRDRVMRLLEPWLTPARPAASSLTDLVGRFARWVTRGFA